MSSTISSHPDSKRLSSPPSYQSTQTAIGLQQHPSVTANPTLQPQGTGTTQQLTYPPQPTQPMTNPTQLHSPPQPTMQHYPPTMQPNPTTMQNPATIQQAQYIPPLTLAQNAELYRDQLYANCANGQHQWDTVYGSTGIITAIICFPIGLLALLADKKTVCAVCKITLPA